MEKYINLCWNKCEWQTKQIFGIETTTQLNNVLFAHPNLKLNGPIWKEGNAVLVSVKTDYKKLFYKGRIIQSGKAEGLLKRRVIR